MAAVDDEMTDGYRDGFRDERTTMPNTVTNRSAAYIHGWMNGRDDRLGQPRQSAAAARVHVEAIRRYYRLGFYQMPTGA